jgi:hypothetical protein
LHTKYRFNKEKTSVRASAGLGRRTSNIFAQHQYILASQRDIRIIASNNNDAYGLEQEVAFNTGVSIEHKFRMAYFPASITADFFHTSFMQEVMIDRETDNIVRFYNMENGTRSNSFQLQLDMNPMRRTDIRVAYRIFDVKSLYRDLGNERIEKPFISRHRGFVNLTQSTRSKWQFSSTLQLYGVQRIPGKQFATVNPGYYFTKAKAYTQLNFQVSKQFKSKPFEIYLGAENLLNFKQENPIINAENPFDPSFDAGMVWGPVFGRMIYGGFRWRIKKDYNEALKSIHEHTDKDHEDH